VAPVLLCPECGTKHPLDGVGSRSAFPCSGCGRTLKVPAVAHAAADAPLPTVPPPPIDDLPWPSASASASASAVSSAAADPHATQTIAAASIPPAPAPFAGSTPLGAPLPPADLATPEVPARGASAADTAVGELIPGRPIRFLLWFVAVPLAFLIVFALARAVGLLTTNEVTDVALAEGWSRFWPIVRLLPFVALATAGILQGSVYGIARLRAKRRTSSSNGGKVTAPGLEADTGQQPRVRQSSRNGA
jgi:hypothetical protein